jgi:hypothetical protein
MIEKKEATNEPSSGDASADQGTAGT